jgi:diphosphoinositol-polyphosphate diphosphatase
MHQHNGREDSYLGIQPQNRKTKFYVGKRSDVNSLDGSTDADSKEKTEILQQERCEIEYFRNIQIEVAKSLSKGFSEPVWDDFGRLSNFPRIQYRNATNFQRCNPIGEHILGGFVAISADKSKVLIIRSIRRNEWVLLKGRLGSVDKTLADPAICKAWEEVGITVTIVRYLGMINGQRVATSLPLGKESYCFYEAKVQLEYDSFPQAHWRSPVWVSYKTAQEVMSKRPDFLEALNRSSI